MTSTHLTLSQPTRSETAREQAFQGFLDRHLDQEMLRFTTAGSVDDGKSTLIGRLLHDTRSVYEDQLASIRASRINRSGGELDLSLLTDGLRAEREQGITIDVAYRYFSTAKRKFIIADTPGHEQYTRNMATGASTADVAIVLIDAKAFVKAGGLLPQSRRHTFIASLLRIPNIVAAVNKMDLVDYSEAVFHDVRSQFLELARRLKLSSIELIPVSALVGDNIVEPSTSMPWYEGPTLLEYLEAVPLQTIEATSEPLRFPVQLVLRPDAVFRGFAGRVERGELRVGQPVRALPSGRTTRVSSIVTYDGELNSAQAPQSVTVTLEDEIDLSRGEMLIDVAAEAPLQSNAFSATLVWMSEQPLVAGQSYLLKHTTRTVRASVHSIRHRVDVVTGEHQRVDELHMNDIAEVEFDTSLPLFFDSYTDSRPLGSFILIDSISNVTAAAGMITAPADHNQESIASRLDSAFVWLPGNLAAAARVRQSFRQAGKVLVDVDDSLIPELALPAVIRALQLAKVSAVSTRSELQPSILDAVKKITGDGWIEQEQALQLWPEDVQ